MYRAAIITLSDKGFLKLREDISANVIKEIICKYDYKNVYYKILPDEINVIIDELKYICDNSIADVIFTTGGTGFSKRDITPEATICVGEKIVPGISEAMRMNSFLITKRAMLGRGVSVIRKNTLIINLPGSPKAVKENLEYIIDTIQHGLDILIGNDSECGKI